MDERIAAPGVSGRLLAPADAPDLQRERRLCRLFALGALACCVADARFTLLLIHNAGFYEANPVMDALLRHDVRAFVAVKLLLTGGGLLVLLRHAGLRLFGALTVTQVLGTIFTLYAGLVFYEVSMLAVFT